MNSKVKKIFVFCLMIVMILFYSYAITTNKMNLNLLTSLSNFVRLLFDADINDTNTKELYAGYGKVSIYPDFNNPDISEGGVPLLGQGNPHNRVATKNNQGITGEDLERQKIYATAVAISENGDKNNTVIFITLDLVGIGQEIADMIRNNIAQETEIAMDRIMISCTHTHSAPDAGFNNEKYEKLIKSMDAYRNDLINNVTQAALNAVNDMKI